MNEISVRATLSLAAVLILIVTPAPACAQADPGAASPDSAAIHGVWSTVDALWNARDAQTFSELFTEDASFEFVDRREVLGNRSIIHQHFAERFPQFAPDLRHRTTVQDIRRITPDAHAVTGKVDILRVGADDGAEPAALRSFVIFAVMLRTGDGFRIHTLRAYQPG